MFGPLLACMTIISAITWFIYQFLRFVAAEWSTCMPSSPILLTVCHRASHTSSISLHLTSELQFHGCINLEKHTVNLGSRQSSIYVCQIIKHSIIGEVAPYVGLNHKQCQQSLLRPHSGSSLLALYKFVTHKSCCSMLWSPWKFIRKSLWNQPYW